MMRILGIDPGYDRCGIAVAEKETGGAPVLIYSECVTPPKGARADRLSNIVTRLRKVIAAEKPSGIAIETLFFSKNQKTALAVAEARGALLAAAAAEGLPVHEYSPQAIKIAITGHGAAPKAQIAALLPKLIHIEKNIRYDDEYDAIAAALTHLVTNQGLQ